MNTKQKSSYKGRFLWYLTRAANEYCWCKPGARSAKKILTTLNWITRFLWYLARAARRNFCFCNPGASSAEKILTPLNWIIYLLWYLARAARRKFYSCNPGARSAEKTFCSARLGHPFSLASGNAGATLGQRWCKKTRM